MKSQQIYQKIIPNNALRNLFETKVYLNRVYSFAITALLSVWKNETCFLCVYFIFIIYLFVKDCLLR